MRPLSPKVLRHLMSEALVPFLGHAERFEAALVPGCALVRTHEPVADLNYLVVGPGAEVDRRFCLLYTSDAADE